MSDRPISYWVRLICAIALIIIGLFLLVTQTPNIKYVFAALVIAGVGLAAA